MSKDHKEMSVLPGASPSGDCVTYEYGIRLDQECLGDVGEQIMKSRRLYNDIVAQIRQILDDMRAFELSHAGDDARHVQEAIEQLNTDFKSAKAADDEKEMQRIAADRREKWKALSVLLKAVRKTHRQEINERFMSKIGKNSSCPTYQLRSQAVADGLGWGTANAVLDAALQAFKKSFVLGKAPRFASGQEIDQDCLTLQFTTAGGVSVDALLAGRQGDLSILPSNGCGKRKYGEIKFRLGAAKANAYATGTWQYHRPLPEGSSIAIARLVRRRVGFQFKWALQLLVKPKSPVSEIVGNRKPLVAVHFGWAADITGRRVAAIADAADPGTANILALPTVIEESLNRSAEIQGRRDSRRDQIAPMVRAIDVPDTVDEQLRDLMGRIRKTRPQDISANRIHYLCRLLRNADLVPDWLESWRKEDKLAWQDQVSIARRARNARKGFYRATAITLARSYETIAIEPLELAEAALKVNERTGEKTEFAKKARAGRVVAALFEFESAIRWAAVKTGAAILEISGATSSRCSYCGGTTQPTEDDYQTLCCHECGAIIDRKQNGAAVAWQGVYAVREDVVADYWSAHFEKLADKSKTKGDKLQKMAEGRRRARTGSGE